MPLYGRLRCACAPAHLATYPQLPCLYASEWWKPRRGCVRAALASVGMGWGSRKREKERCRGGGLGNAHLRLKDPGVIFLDHEQKVFYTPTH